jgi:DNA-binding NarL/FixJ family response regulator
MPTASTADAAAAAPLRVLLVDDSELLRTRVRLALERTGLRVVGEAADGAQALAEAAAHRPDVVLMDLRMPGMDGVEATRRLRSRQPGTPVVLWTGESDEQLASAVRRSGACAGLRKGVDTAEMVATLRRACGAAGREGRPSRPVPPPRQPA